MSFTLEGTFQIPVKEHTHAHTYIHTTHMRANITLYDRVCYRPSFVVHCGGKSIRVFFAFFLFFTATQCRMCRDSIKYYTVNRNNLIVYYNNNNNTLLRRRRWCQNYCNLVAGRPAVRGQFIIFTRDVCRYFNNILLSI